MGDHPELQLVRGHFERAFEALPGERRVEKAHLGDAIRGPVRGGVDGFKLRFCVAPVPAPCIADRDAPTVVRLALLEPKWCAQGRDRIGFLLLRARVDEHDSGLTVSEGHQFEVGLGVGAPVRPDVRIDHLDHAVLVAGRYVGDVLGLHAAAGERRHEAGAYHVVLERAFHARQPVDIDRVPELVVDLKQLELPHPGRAFAPVGGHHAGKGLVESHVAQWIARGVEKDDALGIGLAHFGDDRLEQLGSGQWMVRPHGLPVDSDRAARAAIEVPDVEIVVVEHVDDLFDGRVARLGDIPEAKVVLREPREP